MAGEVADRQEKARGRKMTSINETPGLGNDVVYAQDYNVHNRQPISSWQTPMSVVG
jgi:hypothetical protein